MKAHRAWDSSANRNVEVDVGGLFDPLRLDGRDDLGALLGWRSRGRRSGGVARRGRLGVGRALCLGVHVAVLAVATFGGGGAGLAVTTLGGGGAGLAVATLGRGGAGLAVATLGGSGA